METETKICPYCKEEIKIEAVKCKHCGEFLNTKTPLKIRPLKPQNYNLAFYAAYLAIVISIYIINSRSKYELFMSNGFPDNNDIFEFPELLFIFGSVVFAILTFFILWELGKYLRNFDNKKINKNTWIFFLITITVTMK